MRTRLNHDRVPWRLGHNIPTIHQLRLHAPYGVTDTLGMHLRPNARRAPREVYDAKVARWRAQWPALRAEPWPCH